MNFKPGHELINVEPRIAVLVTSDSKFRKLLEEGHVIDESGKLVLELMKSVGYIVHGPIITPNDSEVIKSITKYLINKLGMNTIVITGGTGVSEKDVSTDAILELSNKILQGFGELFRRLSENEIGLNTILTRACAVIYSKAVIFCLPGSPKAVKLGIERIIIPVLKHLLSELYR